MPMWEFKINLINTEYSQCLQVYTDGSKKHDEAACAYHIPALHANKGFFLGKHISVYTAELTAITMALHYLVQLPVSINNIVILSDPKSALTSILTGNSTRPSSSSDYCGTPSRRYLHNEITWLTNTLTLNGSTVIFQWVPSHIGLRSNDMADKLANLALK